MQNKENFYNLVKEGDKEVRFDFIVTPEMVDFYKSPQDNYVFSPMTEFIVNHM
jgi:hypothetical protein